MKDLVKVWAIALYSSYSNDMFGDNVVTFVEFVVTKGLNTLAVIISIMYTVHKLRNEIKKEEEE